MNRLVRRRAVSGMLGLLAMSLSLAEAGAASMCDPAMPMQHEGDVAGAEFDGMADGGVHDMDHGMAHDMGSHTPVTSHDSHPGGHETVQGDDTDPAPCPWMPMMGSGCGAPVVVPAAAAGLANVAPSPARTFRATRQLATLHSTDPLRRPPRA